MRQCGLGVLELELSGQCRGFALRDLPFACGESSGTVFQLGVAPGEKLFPVGLVAAVLHRLPLRSAEPERAPGRLAAVELLQAALHLELAARDVRRALP